MLQRFDLNVIDGHNFIINQTMNIKDLDCTETNEVSHSQELLISQKDMKSYKEQFDRESLAKKRQYLQAIQEHNNTLIGKIKEFDQRVNKEVSSLAKKIVPKKKFVVPAFEEMETKLLRDKFEEFERLRKEIENKRSGTDSLEFLLIVKKKYEIRLNELSQSIAMKKKEIQHLRKIKKKSESERNIVHQEITKIGELDIFNREIDDLRQKVHEKNQGLKAKKQEFLSLYKQNRSNKSIMLQSTVKEEKNEEEDPQLLALKQQYETLGKRVDALRLKKSSLQDQLKLNAQETKKLQRLKSRQASPPKK